MRTKSFAARRVQNVLVYAHGAKAPSDEEWNGVLAMYDEAHAVERLCALVYTDGAAPNAAQRARLNAKLGPRRVRIAVLTSSALARAAGTAVNWFRPDVCIFGPTDIAGALRHLDVPPEVAPELTLVLQELKYEVGVA
jgi:hypothetical protein